MGHTVVLGTQWGGCEKSWGLKYIQKNRADECSTLFGSHGWMPCKRCIHFKGENL